MIQKAKIVAIDGNLLTCAIECNEACAGCSAKAMCGKKEDKIIELVNTCLERNVGDIIEIEVDNRAGFKAIGIAYLLPVVIIITMLVITQAIGLSEMWQAIITLASVVIYYIFIKIFGFGRSISITIIE